MDAKEILLQILHSALEQTNHCCEGCQEGHCGLDHEQRTHRDPVAYIEGMPEGGSVRQRQHRQSPTGQQPATTHNRQSRHHSLPPGWGVVSGEDGRQRLCCVGAEGEHLGFAEVIPTKFDLKGPGGVETKYNALVSADGRYRYWLTRTWGPGTRVCWVMLNPSTADATVDDPTIRRCMAFSKAWGHGSLIVVNLWAARATEPKALLTLSDPCGPDNAEAIDLAVNGSAAVVLAWGRFAGRMKDAERLRLWPESSAKIALVPVYTLGRTKDGHPRHPLYVHGDTALEPVWLPAQSDGSDDA